MWRVVASGGRDPTSTLEGIQLDETTGKPLGIEWEKRLAIRRATGRGTVA